MALPASVRSPLAGPGGHQGQEGGSPDEGRTPRSGNFIPQENRTPPPDEVTRPGLLERAAPEDGGSFGGLTAGTHGLLTEQLQGKSTRPGPFGSGRLSRRCCGFP